MTDKIKDIIVTFSFSILIISLFLINIVKSDSEISISERRKLEQFPDLTLSKLFDGTFFEKFDSYTTDQFFERDNLRKTKVKLELCIKNNYNNLYVTDDYIIEQIYPLDEKSINNLIKKITNIKNNYLSNNNIYFTIVPDKNYFVNSGNLKLDYSRMEDMMIRGLPFAKYINIFSKLELADYYKTDTHWKQENIFKVADTISSEMGVKISNNYETVKIMDFKGVYSGRLPVSSSTDEIKILKNEIIDNALVYDYEKGIQMNVYNFYKKNSLDKYDIYLSGAVPIIDIINKYSDNGKELIVFRDSYASSLVPLLIEAYDKITLIDTRYVSPKILNEYVNFDGKDVLFMYSSLLINNSSSIK